MARRNHDGRAAYRPAHRGLKRAEDRSRLDQRRQQARRHVELAEQVDRPLAPSRVHHLRRRRARVFRPQVAGEPVVQDVGNRSQLHRRVQQPRGGARRRDQLIERVEREELDPRDVVDARPRHAREDVLHDAVGPRVPVVVGIGQEVPVLPDQPVVAAPGVDADAFQARPPGRDLLERPLHVQPEPGDVPIERAVHADRFVGETADFREPEHPRPEMPRHRASTLSTKVEGEEMGTHGDGRKAYVRAFRAGSAFSAFTAFHCMERGIGRRTAGVGPKGGNRAGRPAAADPIVSRCKTGPSGRMPVAGAAPRLYGGRP